MGREIEITATDGGTFALQIAQAVSSGNPVAVNSGSWIEVDPLN